MNLEIQSLSKAFVKDQPVLDRVSCTLEGGKFSALLGPSGCGKTTLLRILAGLETANEGRVTLAGETFYDSAANITLPAERRNIGMVFQSYAVWPHMTVFDNVAFPLRVRGGAKSQIHHEVMEILKVIHMEGFEKRMPSALSGGQQQRVALARALIQKPKLLLLDEPLSNLDASLRASMRREIRRLQEEFKITAVIVTHDWKDAQDLCDRVVILRSGRVEQIGTPREVAANPASDFVRSITGAG